MKNAKISEQKIGRTLILRTLVFELQMIERILQVVIFVPTVRFNTECRTRSKIPGVLPTISHPFSIFSRRSYILLVHSSRTFSSRIHDRSFLFQRRKSNGFWESAVKEERS